jgi:hypothetical protein
MARLVRGAAADIEAEQFGADRGHKLLSLVANAAVSLGVAPRMVIEKDLADLRSRDYLEPYFSR